MRVQNAAAPRDGALVREVTRLAELYLSQQVGASNFLAQRALGMVGPLVTLSVASIGFLAATTSSGTGGTPQPSMIGPWTLVGGGIAALLFAAAATLSARAATAYAVILPGNEPANWEHYSHDNQLITALDGQNQLYQQAVISNRDTIARRAQNIRLAVALAIVAPLVSVIGWAVDKTPTFSTLRHWLGL